MMKRITLTLSLVLLAVTSAWAQTTHLKIDSKAESQDPMQQLRITDASVNEALRNFDRRQSAAGWYSFATDYIGFNGLTPRGTVNFLFPDSSHIYFSDGLGRVFNHVYGASFDPKDIVFQQRFSRWTSYTIDSMNFARFYLRNVDSMDVVTSNIAATGTITILDWEDLSGETLEIDGQSFTEGDLWDAEDSNEETAASLITALQVTLNNLFIFTREDNVIHIENRVSGPDGNTVTLSSTNNASMEVSAPTLEGGELVIEHLEVVDTLYVQYFNGSNEAFSIRSLNFLDDPNTTYYCALPRIETFVPRVMTNTAALRTDTILLRGEDKNEPNPDGTFTSPRFTMPVGLSATGSDLLSENLFSATFLFKTMKKSETTDTIASFTENVTVSNPNNLLGLPYLFQDGHVLRISDLEAMNNAFSTSRDLKFGNAGQGNWRAYRPLLNAVNSFLFYVSTDNLDVNTLDPVRSYALGDAYPNPAGNSDLIQVPFLIGKSQPVSFTLTDITGRVVKTVMQPFEAGENTVSFNASELKSGVYFCQMTTGNFKAVTKVVVLKKSS